MSRAWLRFSQIKTRISGSCDRRESRIGRVFESPHRFKREFVAAGQRGRAPRIESQSFVHGEPDADAGRVSTLEQRVQVSPMNSDHLAERLNPPSACVDQEWHRQLDWNALGNELRENALGCIGADARRGSATTSRFPWNTRGDHAYSSSAVA